VATVDELLAEASDALDLADRDERAARLFVLAGRLQATGDERATAEARALLAKAARDGSALAAFDLAMLLLAGRGGDVDTAAGLAELGRAATELPSAAAVLGGMLLFDAERAPDGIAWLRQAAAHGEPSAFWLLGAAHLRGLGVAVDERQARMLVTAAAEAGVVEAQLELARLYVAGVGGARDEVAAARWERAAAEAGSADGCLRVAERAARKPGGAALAIPWLERAANAGSAEAAARLAHLYFMGREVTRDEAAALRWMELANALGWQSDPE
jgi:TPR repeat protein